MRNLYLRQDLNHQIFLVQKIAIYCFLGTFLSKNTSFRRLELLAAKSLPSDLFESPAPWTCTQLCSAAWTSDTFPMNEKITVLAAFLASQISHATDWFLCLVIYTNILTYHFSYCLGISDLSFS